MCARRVAKTVLAMFEHTDHRLPHPTLRAGNRHPFLTTAILAALQRRPIRKASEFALHRNSN